jgi:hypothetical protein
MIRSFYRTRFLIALVNGVPLLSALVASLPIPPAVDTSCMFALMDAGFSRRVRFLKN